MKVRSSFLLMTVVGLLTINSSAYPGSTPPPTLGHGLVLVTPKKMPAESKQAGISMTLHLVDPQTLYLYVEEQSSQRLAIYDVTDPGKIKLKKVVQLAVRGPYDFVQSANASMELIRYRDGGGSALLDVSRPKEPRVIAVGSPTGASYITPSQSGGDSHSSDNGGTDYVIYAPDGGAPVATIKGIVSQQRDSGNGTTYLLGPNGLVEIRDIRQERRLAASVPPWTNTIDDN